MELAELKNAIYNRGVKQTFIASKLGVSKALVNQWLKEQTPIAERHKIELKSILKISA